MVIAKLSRKDWRRERGSEDRKKQRYSKGYSKKFASEHRGAVSDFELLRTGVALSLLVPPTLVVWRCFVFKCPFRDSTARQSRSLVFVLFERRASALPLLLILSGLLSQSLAFPGYAERSVLSLAVRFRLAQSRVLPAPNIPKILPGSTTGFITCVLNFVFRYW